MDDLRALEHKHISLWSSDDLTIVEAFAGLVHHSDRGTQYLSMRYTDRLADAGIAPSVGSRGDSYDNALAESVIGLFKTEVIRRLGPWRHLEAVEFATLDWVDWFNHRRLLGPIGYVPPRGVRGTVL
jgi:putative transposase